MPIRRRAAVAIQVLAVLLLAFPAFAQEETPRGEAPSAGASVDDAAPESESGAEPEARSTDADPSAPDGEAAPEPESGDELEEVDGEEDPSSAEAVEEFLVTSRKIEILVPDTTVSAIGFDPEQLKAEGIKDIRDLSNFTPSLDIKSAFAASNPTIFIRGVGLDDYNANAASAVAIYQDGVYMQSPAGQLFQFFDAADVAVLRGPQPTLYRNASAGAILVRSAEPTDELATYVSTTYGRFNEIDVEGAVGGPIVPGWLSGRLSGTWGVRDGVTENRCASLASVDCLQADGTIRAIDPGAADFTNNVDAYAARGQLLFELPVGEAETQWLLNAHGGQNRSRALQYQHRGVRFQAPEDLNDPTSWFIPFPLPQLDVRGYKDTDDDPYAGDYDLDGSEDLSLWGVNLRGSGLFGDGYELASLTAYEWHERHTLENSDASPNFLLNSDYGDTAWQVSQQLELRGNWSESEIGDGNWVLGAFYLQEDLDVDNFFEVPTDFGPDLIQQYTQKTRNFAAYAWSEYKLQPGCETVSCDFTLTTGLRYNWEYKSFDTLACNFTAPRCRTSLAGDVDELWGGPGGEASLAWNFLEDADFYLKYSRGWKGGHFNGGAFSAFDIVTGVDPEKLDSYEAGLRSYWFDRRLMLNVTGFYYGYEDLQVFILEQTPAGFPITKLVNAADTLIYGVEVDLGAEPLPGLTFTYNFAWVDSEYRDFVISLPFEFGQERLPGGPRDPVQVRFNFDYSGNPMIASPRYAMAGSVGYEIPLPGQLRGFSFGTLTPRFSFSWKDDLSFDASSGRGTLINFPVGTFGQEAYWVFNGSLRWRSEDGRFELLGWVHNFLDERYKVESFDLSREFNFLLDVYAEPRTYGITATISF